MSLAERLENLFSLKHTSIAFDFLDRGISVEELIDVWILGDVCHSELNGVCCPASRLDRLTFCVIIIGLEMYDTGLPQVQRVV